MSSPALFPRYVRVSTQLDHPGTFHNIPIQLHKTSTLNFDLKLYVRFEKRCGQSVTHVFNIPQLLSSHYISCDEFFRNGPSFLRRNLLFHDVITIELLDELIPIIMFSARLYYDLVDEDGLVLMIPLAIGLVIDLPMNVDIEDVAGIILSEYYSMQEVKTIPDSEEVIQSLTRVVLPEGSDDSGQCGICLGDFEEGMEVSAMACHHLFHHYCVVQWLKTSNTCPLCGGGGATGVVV